MTIQTGYTIASITALKALNSTQRTDGYARLVKSLPAWYIFSESSTAAADDDATVMPDDTPSNGRWLKSSGAGGGVDFAGEIICTGACSIGGKAFKFYAPQSALKLKIVPGFDTSITPGSNSIQLHRWDQEPNTGLSGRHFVAEVSDAGGEVSVTIDSTYRWISLFAKNPSKSGQFDGMCFTVIGNTITLLGF